MSWFSNGLNEDIAVSTRIRLARNIDGIPFPAKMTAEQFNEVKSKIKDIILKNGSNAGGKLNYIEMKDIPENERLSMVERHIVSPQFVSNCENRAIIISEDETVSVMIGEEDHIRIQVIISGFNLEKAYGIAEQIDKLLCDNLDIAFDGKLGFLTECPTNLGTGLRASVMLHLPVTESMGNIGKIAESANKIGFTVRGTYGEGSKSRASLYQISNQITLGVSEKNAIDNLKVITSQIIEKEKQSYNSIDKRLFEDNCMRSLGILKYARILSSEEMMKHLSNIKLGISIGIIKDNICPTKLLIEGMPYMLMKKFGDMTPDERDIYRANMIRKELENI
ncbi:MAG: protein arginine kinase [Clostridia bacterium]|nr:protein arginine kinase [Clostridia bacterium]